MYQSNTNIPYYYQNMYENNFMRSDNLNFRQPPRPPRPPMGRPGRFGGGFILPFTLGFLASPLLNRPPYPQPYPYYPYQPYPYYPF